MRRRPPAVLAVGLTIGVIILLEAARAARGQPLPNAMPWPVVAVVFAAFVGGLGPGLISALIAGLYVFFMHNDYRFGGQLRPGEAMIILSWGVALPTIAGMAGVLRDRLAAAVVREAARRAHDAEVRRQAEADRALAESETQRSRDARTHAEVLDALPAHVALFDHTGRLVAVNRTWREFARQSRGHGGDVLSARALDDLTANAPDDCKDTARQMVDGIREVLDGRRPRFEAEYPCPQESGAPPLCLRLECAPIDLGGVRGVVVMQTDVTQRRRAEAALLDSQAQLAGLFARLPDAAWVFDLETLRILAVNAAAVRQYGYTEAEFLAMTIRDIRPPEDIPRLEAAMAARPPGAFNVGRWRHRRKDGTLLTVQVSSLAHTFEGRPARIAVMRDVTRQHAEEEALRASERRFREVADSAAALIWTCDAAGKPTYYNRTWLTWRGVEAAEELAQGHLRAVHPEDRPRVEKALRDALAGHRPFTAEYRMARAGGTYGWVLEQAVPRPGPSGVPEGMTSCLTEITEMRRASEKIHSSEMALRVLLAAIPDLIFRLRRDGTYLGYTAPPGAALPVPPEQFIGRRFQDVLPPDLAQRTADAVDQVIATGQPQQFEYQTPASPTPRSWEARVVPAAAEELLMIVRDITARRQAELARRASEDRLRVQLDRMPLACMLVDPQGRVLQWNPAAERIFGYSFEELTGVDLVERIVPPAARAHVDPIVQRLLQGDMAAHSTNENLTKDGRTIVCEWHNTPITGPDGRVIAMLLMAQDVTEKRRLEEELRQSQKMDAIGHLAGGVAHDFNNLLTAIFGHTALARRTLAQQHPAHASLQRVEEAARQAQGVTKALLTFARESAGDRRPYRLAHAVRDAVRLLRRTLPAGIAFRADYDVDAPLWIEGDPTQMQQVVLNLAINARDAMPQGGTLSIQVAPGPRPDDAPPDAPAPAVLTVTDTGVGMTPDVQQRLFEPFFTTKPPGEGTGLGLAIVHGIVRDHGGRVAVRSAPGEGTTFTITIPGVTPPRGDPAEPGAAPTPMGRGELVLLADDHTFVREIVASMLTTLGYRVRQCPDGAALVSAWIAARAEAAALVVDADMPAMGGADAVAAIRAAGGSLPAVLITGNPRQPPQPAGTTLLRKPFQMHELGEALAEVLGSSPDPAALGPGGHRA